MQSLVSVLIPAYNHGKYIEECILSIAAQTFENIELVIIDDGSVDDTWLKIQQLGEALRARFTSVIFLHQENIGTSGTVMKLRQLSTGDYIIPIASDDRMKPDMISTLYSEITKNSSYGFVVGDSEIIDSDSNRVYWDKNQKITYDQDTAEYRTFGDFLQKRRSDVDFHSEQFGSYRSLLRSNYIPNGFIVKGDLYRSEHIFNSAAPLEDWYAMMQLSKMTKMHFVDKIVSSYRWHDTNAVKDNKKLTAYHNRTLKFELSSIMDGGDAELKKFVDIELFGDKIIFKIGKMLSLYKKTGCKFKTFILTIGNRKIFSLRCKYKNPQCA